jgi:S-adenosylmethionine:tRNA ribosyltransferase-isomerase
MRIDVFDYQLPRHLIAQEPLPQRDDSRLMVVKRASAAIEHHHFHDLPNILANGDLLVLNDTRVLPARLVGRRARTNGKWEGLFLRQLSDGAWELLCQTRGRLTVGEVILVEPGRLELVLLARTEEGHWVARPTGGQDASVDTRELLQRHGRVPLPPYIRKGRPGPSDRGRYQTVFAREPGAVAAPTAGLHFTPELFARLDGAGISRVFVTLHVGLGTFQPIEVDAVADHHMHSEWCELGAESAKAIGACRAQNRPVVAVGTTSVRVLETVAAQGQLRPWSGWTDLYIYPPHRFQMVDVLITNFHLPRTSLLVLVSAFGGIDLIREAYKKAIEAEYRFYSYGDAMLIM